MPEAGLRPRLAPLAVLAGGTAGVLYLLAFDPHQPGHLFPRCPFRALTGLQCPACGGTRMAYDLLHGDLSAAWGDNALLFVAAPFALWLLARWAVTGLRGRVYRVALSGTGVRAVLGTALTWAVVRNLGAG